MKYCGMCKENKPVEEFGFKNKKLDKRSTSCKSCHREYSKKHYVENSDGYKKRARKRNEDTRKDNLLKIIEYFKTHPCVDCDEDDFVVLDFDHITDKKKNVSKMMAGYNWDTVMEEINKCEVRCANCHRRKTAKQFSWYSWIE